jgi:GrpB-like predicted nucleotidyltransferase (UPF0157 family)
LIVRVVPYDTSWPARYAAEALRIRAALGELVTGIHHIGSTSVPGLHAKPIIDVLVEVADLGGLDARSAEMEKLGYEAKGEFGISGRRYFRRDDERGERTHQVHAFSAAARQLERHLAFRDYLIAHPEVAREYVELKQRLVAQFSNDINGYWSGKDSFIKHHEAVALAWRSGQRAP